MDDRSFCLFIYEKHNSEPGSYKMKITFPQVNFVTCARRTKIGLYPE